ncbi:MAG TPA: hypothetical protein VHM70_11610 [Polyangiaceae bacterium]|jgi:hypothetical protein|nr:hypothetical protein [Polyangiaceae bacterium]
MKRRLAHALFLLLVGCTEQPLDSAHSTDGGAKNQSKGVAAPKPTYDDAPPHAHLSDAGADGGSQLPLAVIGEDTGEPGLVYAGALAGYYILRVQRGDGSYRYQYDPSDDSWPEGDSVHRQCGATFTLLWLYRITERPEFAIGAGAALEYLTSQGHFDDEGRFEMVDLGATALIALSLTEYARLEHTRRWDHTIDGVGQSLLSAIAEDGSFNQGSTLAWAQAHQALWRIYSHTGDERYLDALRHLARHSYDNRDDRKVVDEPYLYGLWANEPLTELYRIDRQQWLEDFVLDIAERVSKVQYTEDNTDDPRMLGGYPSRIGQPAIWNTSLKLEAVIDGYRLARMVGDERADALGASALGAAQFLMRLQYRSGDTDGWPSPTTAIGGVPFSFDNPVIRVDLPHHAANAILKVADYLGTDRFAGPRTSLELDRLGTNEAGVQ